MQKDTIAQILRDMRTEHNLRQGDIAKALGIDRSAYSGYETGRTGISSVRLSKLADIYNVSLDRLVGRQEVDEITKIRVTNFSNEIDPIAILKSDEQLLLMLYRISDDEKKERILEMLSEEAKEQAHTEE